jgi:hypothetical protein
MSLINLSPQTPIIASLADWGMSSFTCESYARPNSRGGAERRGDFILSTSAFSSASCAFSSSISVLIALASRNQDQIRAGCLAWAQAEYRRWVHEFLASRDHEWCGLDLERICC